VIYIFGKLKQCDELKQKHVFITYWSCTFSQCIFIL